MNDIAASVCIVLLAAGNASRFGSAKQVAPIAGVSMVRHCATTACATGADVVVVTGAYHELVGAQLHGLPVTTVFNPDWEEGMGGSIALGVRTASAKAAIDAVVVMLADQPRVSADDLRALIAAHRRQRDVIVTASAGGVHVPPCLFPRALFGELGALHGKSGARPVVERHRDSLVAIDMPSAGFDIDTVDDYRALVRPNA